MTNTSGYFDAGFGRFVISPGFGGLAALTAALVALYIGTRQIRATAKEAARSRSFERKADAYVGILTDAEQLGLAFRQAAEEFLFPKPGVTPTPAPGLDAGKSFASRALLSAHGSPEVQSAFLDWRVCLGTMQRYMEVIIHSQRPGSPYTATFATQASSDFYTTARTEEPALRRKLADLINGELAEPDVPGWFIRGVYRIGRLRDPRIRTYTVRLNREEYEKIATAAKAESKLIPRYLREAQLEHLVVQERMKMLFSQS